MCCPPEIYMDNNNGWKFVHHIFYACVLYPWKYLRRNMVSIHFPWRMNFALLKWITTKGGCVFCSIQVVLVDRLQFQIETKSFRWVRIDEWCQRPNLFISIFHKNIPSEFWRCSSGRSFMVSLGRIFHVWEFTFLVQYVRFHQLIHALVTWH